jgi:hypothetical protein
MGVDKYSRNLGSILFNTDLEITSKISAHNNNQRTKQQNQKPAVSIQQSVCDFRDLSVLTEKLAKTNTKTKKPKTRHIWFHGNKPTELGNKDRMVEHCAVKLS